MWDLDPGPEVAWPDVVQAARLVRRVLRTLGLRAWVKTTGGRGLHVVVPIAPQRDWSECLEFATLVARAVARADPAKYTLAFAKAGRERLTLIDYLRNNRTNTSVCAFSPRAREDATVSMPVPWRALHRHPSAYTVLTVPRLLRRSRDPWAGYWSARQSITTPMIQALRRL